MPKLKPLSKEEDLQAVPVEEPVLVELEPVASGAEPEGDDGQPEPKPAKVEKPDPDAGAKVLQTQMEEMRKANDRITRERDEAIAREREARAGQADTESDLIANALQAAQREAVAAKAAVKAAFENSDAEALADAQERLGRAAADTREYERAAAVQASEKEREKATPQRQERQPTDITSMVDRMQVMPAEREWLIAHPDSIMDPGRNKELDVAYMKATRKQLIRGTPEYFKFIESEMGYQTQQAENGDDERTTNVSAPVSRDSRSSVSGKVNTNRIELSPAEREQARLMGISDIAYAKGKKQMNDEKRLYPEKFAARA